MSDEQMAYEVEVLKLYNRAAAEMDVWFRPRLRAHGRSKSREEGEDVADQVCTDAIKEDEHGHAPLLCQWRAHGGKDGTLEGYLKSVVTNHLYSRHRRGRKVVEWQPGEELPGEEDASLRMEKPALASPDEKKVTRDASRAAKLLLRGVQATVKRHPREIVCYWLVRECGCKQRALCSMLAPAREARGEDVNEATITNWVTLAEKASLQPLREAIAEESIAARDVAAAVTRWGSALMWGALEPAAPAKPDRETKLRLQKLVSGRVPPAERNALVSSLATQPALVRWLGSLIQQGGAADADWRLRGPEHLRGLHGHLTREALRLRHRLGPLESGRLLLEAQNGLFDLFRRITGAGTGTLWLISADRRQLVAAFNPVEGRGMLGQTQPRADGGIIWRVWDSGKPERVALMRGNERFSDAMDRRTRQQSQSMIAVPFHLHGEMHGVLTLLRTGADAPAFPLGHLENAAELSALLGAALEAALAREVLASASARSAEAPPALATARQELAELWPALLSELDGSVLASWLPKKLDAVIEAVCRDIGAQTGSLWLPERAADGSAQLVIRVNPREPQLIGHAQPDSQGIVGACHRLGQAFCIADVRAMQQWAGQEVDRKAGQITRSLITVPLWLHGTAAGVLSWVWQSADAPAPDESALQTAQQAARWLESTLEYQSTLGLLSPLPNRRARAGR